MKKNTKNPQKINPKTKPSSIISVNAYKLLQQRKDDAKISSIVDLNPTHFILEATAYITAILEYLNDNQK